MQEGTACGNNATYRKEQHATLPVAPHTNTYPGRVRTVWLFPPPMVYLLTLTVWFIRKKNREIIKNERSTVALLLRPMLVGYYRMDDGQRHAPDAIFL